MAPFEKKQSRHFFRPVLAKQTMGNTQIQRVLSLSGARPAEGEVCIATSKQIIDTRWRFSRKEIRNPKPTRDIPSETL